jgi:iron complex outermembrane recepter protein
MLEHRLFGLKLVLATSLFVAAGVCPGQEAGTAPSPATGSSSDALADIIVTARRVEERLQDVPISITVFNQQQLSDRNIVSAGDIATYTPSLEVNNSFGSDNSTFAIRGFVEADFTSPSVGVYFADVIAPRTNGGTSAGNGAGVGSFFDLQNVQVLKGPQGTLFGRNTTGGSILLVPEKPNGEFGGYVEQSAGNYDMERTQAVVNLPLNDEIWFRLGVDHQTREGYLNNISGIGPSHFNDVDYTALRASLVVNITPNLENYTIGTWSESTTNGDYPKAFGYTPGSVTDLATSIGRQIAATSGNFYNIANGDPYAAQDVRQWSIINTTTWAIADNFTAKNIVSYSQFRQIQNSNIFGEDGSSPLPGPPGSIAYLVSINGAPGAYNVSQSTTTEEFRLQGTPFDGRLTYQTGGYLEVSLPVDGFQAYYTPELVRCTDPFTFQCSDVIGQVLGAQGFVGSEQLSATEYRFHDYAFYGQATYKILDQLSVTGGVRYTADTTSGLGQVLALHYPAPNVPSFSCGLPSPLVTGGTSAEVMANHGLCDYIDSQSSHAPTWMFDVEYKPTNDVMLYAKDSRGYRQGSVNVSFYGLGNWKPEKVDTYEIGAKTSFLEPIHGTFEVTAFYNDFTNQQLQVNEVACTPQQLGTPQCPFLGSPAAGIANAGKSTIKGIEIDSSISPFHGLRIDFGYAYLDTKLLSVTIPAPPIGFTAVNFPSTVGGPLPFAPKNKASVTPTYTLPLPENYGPVSVGATYTYQSREFDTQTAPPGFQFLAAEKNLNLNLNWDKIMGKPFDLSLFATNVTGEKYFTALSGIYTSFSYDVSYLNPPTMWGARVRYHFGK